MENLRSVKKCLVCGEIGKDLYPNLEDQIFGVEGKWSLLVCPKCSHVWQRQIPQEDHIEKLYDSYYTHNELNENYLRKLLKLAIPVAKFGYSSKDVSSIDKLFAQLITFVGPLKEFSKGVVMGMPAKSGRVLDVGCGAGEFLKLMKKFGWETYGTEIDLKAADVAKEHCNLFHGSIGEIDFKENKFDVITMSHVIEHLSSPDKDLKICHSLLKDEGYISISTPNISSLGAKKFKQDWRGLEVPRHFNIFNVDGLKNLLERNGFKIREVSTPSSIAPYIWNASKQIRDRRLKRSSSPITRLFRTVTSILFWLYEYYKNKRTSCGEEILIVAQK